MKRWPLLLAAAVAALALVETTVALVAPRRVATDADWRAAADHLRQRLRPGDLIVFAPDWADQVGRRWLGDVMTPEMVGRSDDDRFARLWEVSVRGARSDDARGRPLVEETRHGRVRVALHALPAPVAVVHDFTSALGEAIVIQLPADGRGDETPCYRHERFRGDDGSQCPGSRVERRMLEIDYRPRRGVLLPVEAHRVTRVEHPQARLGGRLVCYTGMHDYFSRKNADGVVEFVVRVDGAEVGRARQGNAGWNRLEVKLDPALAAAPHRVAFEARAAAPAWRTFGYHCEARP